MGVSVTIVYCTCGWLAHRGYRLRRRACGRKQGPRKQMLHPLVPRLNLWERWLWGWLKSVMMEGGWGVGILEELCPIFILHRHGSRQTVPVEEEEEEVWCPGGRLRGTLPNTASRWCEIVVKWVTVQMAEDSGSNGTDIHGLATELLWSKVHNWYNLSPLEGLRAEPLIPCIVTDTQTCTLFWHRLPFPNAATPPKCPIHVTHVRKTGRQGPGWNTWAVCLAKIMNCAPNTKFQRSSDYSTVQTNNIHSVPLTQVLSTGWRF